MVTSSVPNNQIPRLNPIMVVESPRLATTNETMSPIPVHTLTPHPYVIPQGKLSSPFPTLRTSPAIVLPIFKIVSGTAIGPVQAQLPQTLTPSQIPIQQLPPQIAQPPSQLQQRLSPLPQQSVTVIKPNASPRPSILRKRDIDGYAIRLRSLWVTFKISIRSVHLLVSALWRKLSEI